VRVAGKTMLRVLGLFDRFLRELVALHYLLTEPVLLDDSALQALIDPVRKDTLFRRRAAHACGRRRRRARIDDDVTKGSSGRMISAAAPGTSLHSVRSSLMRRHPW
jgi:hypothetical protein